MSLQVDVQLAVPDTAGLPTSEMLAGWAQAAYAAARSSADSAANDNATNDNKSADAQLTLRIVDEAEITQLNHAYRHKNAATNVLSFPFELPQGLPASETQGELGDMVICAAVVQREAVEQGKSDARHWAHMVIHGSLHLLGYDHIVDAEAAEMEALEIQILAGLGFPNPYE